MKQIPLKGVKAARPLRLYEGLWHRVRENPNTNIKVFAPKALQARVAKAIRLERWKDEHFRSESYGHTLLTKSGGDSFLIVYLRREAGLDIKRSLDAGEPLFFKPNGEVYHEHN